MKNFINKAISITVLSILFLSCDNEKAAFRWNFNPNSKYVYAFSQTTQSEFKLHKNEDSNASYVNGNGKLILHGKPNDLADLSLEDIKIKLKDDYSNDTISDILPNGIFQDLKSDGTFQTTTNSIDFFRVLLPIPNKKMSLGDTCKIPLSFPFNINGSLFNSAGYNTLTFTKYEDINGYHCAVLEGDINVSKLGIPDSFEGNYEFSQIGNGTYYFNIEKGCYIKAIAKFDISSLIDSEDIYMSSKNTNTYEVNFSEIIGISSNIDISSKKNSVTKTTVIPQPTNTPSDIAKTVIEFLQESDTTKYLNAAIPLDKQKKLFIDNIKYNPQEKDTMEIYRNLTRKYNNRIDNFLVRAGYILDIMKEDKGFDIKKATIDTIYYEHKKIKTYGGFGRTIIGNWADLTVEMLYNDETYYFEIPQIINVDNQWYLYYPEYYLRDKKEKVFVEKRVEQLKQQAEDFWQ